MELRSPFWLNNKEINSIEQALGHNTILKTLNQSQQEKVAALLLSISYAEKWNHRRRSFFTRCKQWLFSYRSKRHFSHIKNKHNQLTSTINQLVHQIQLDKSPTAIFAEYHDTTHTMPIQNAANKKLKEKRLQSILTNFKLKSIQYINDGLEAYQYIFSKN
jgi:hypothetical protein